MLQCLEILRLVSREFEMSDEFWETAPLPYNEFVLGVGGSAHFIRYMRLWNIQREKKSKDMNRLTT